MQVGFTGMNLKPFKLYNQIILLKSLKTIENSHFIKVLQNYINLYVFIYNMAHSMAHILI